MVINDKNFNLPAVLRPRARMLLCPIVDDFSGNNYFIDLSTHAPSKCHYSTQLRKHTIQYGSGVVVLYSSAAADLYNLNVRCGLAICKKIKKQETLKIDEFEPRQMRNTHLRNSAGDAGEDTHSKTLSPDVKSTFLNIGRPL